VTRRIALSLLLALFASACSPPDPEQLASSFTDGCVKGCTESKGTAALDCHAYCECATRKIRENRTDAEFSEFIVDVSFHPSAKATDEIARTAKLCVELQR
jgi:hypothetical protein